MEEIMSKMSEFSLKNLMVIQCLFWEHCLFYHVGSVIHYRITETRLKYEFILKKSLCVCRECIPLKTVTQLKKHARECDIARLHIAMFHYDHFLSHFVFKTKSEPRRRKKGQNDSSTFHVRFIQQTLYATTVMPGLHSDLVTFPPSH
jgi:hypothetical protein